MPRSKRLHCQCDGENVGPCPGPLNCPYSGLGPEDEEMMVDLTHLRALKAQYLETLTCEQEFARDGTDRQFAEAELEAFIEWLAKRLEVK